MAIALYRVQKPAYNLQAPKNTRHSGRGPSPKSGKKTIGRGFLPRLRERAAVPSLNSSYSKDRKSPLVPHPFFARSRNAPAGDAPGSVVHYGLRRGGSGCFRVRQQSPVRSEERRVRE